VVPEWLAIVANAQPAVCRQIDGVRDPSNGAIGHRHPEGAGVDAAEIPNARQTATVLIGCVKRRTLLVAVVARVDGFVIAGVVVGIAAGRRAAVAFGALVFFADKIGLRCAVGQILDANLAALVCDSIAVLAVWPCE